MHVKVGAIVGGNTRFASWEACFSIQGSRCSKQRTELRFNRGNLNGPCVLRSTYACVVFACSPFSYNGTRIHYRLTNT